MKAPAMDASYVRVHRQIGIVPLAENAEAFEIALVRFDVAGGKFAAHARGIRAAVPCPFAAQLLFDLRLDGQAVAIPAGDVRRAKAGHGFRLDDHVFQNLVQAGAEMDFARGIRRPVVQDEKRRFRARFQNAVIEPHLLPGSQLRGFALRQAWPSSGNQFSAD